MEIKRLVNIVLDVEALKAIVKQFDIPMVTPDRIIQNAEERLKEGNNFIRLTISIERLDEQM